MIASGIMLGKRNRELDRFEPAWPVDSDTLEEMQVRVKRAKHRARRFRWLYGSWHCPCYRCGGANVSSVSSPVPTQVGSIRFSLWV